MLHRFDAAIDFRWQRKSEGRLVSRPFVQPAVTGARTLALTIFVAMPRRADERYTGVAVRLKGQKKLAT